MNKTAVKNFAVWAREKLISDITYKAGMLGITEDGIADKLPHSTSDLEFYDIGTKDYAEVSGKEIKQRNALVNAIRKKENDNGDYKSAFGYVVEEVAYTWFNRLIAIRFMEVNDYLPSGVRVLSSENKAKKEPDLVTTPFDTDLEFTSYEQDRIIQLKDDNKLDELFRMLFIKQCNKLHDVLPELFEKTDDYSELLLTVSFTDSDGVLYHLVHDIEEDDFNVEKEGQVQIIGWLYQYYISEKHSSVIDIKGGKAIKKEDVPAATQLFTTHWVVQYMVDNSLGRYWIERNPESDLKSKLKFYVEPENFTTVDEKISPEDLTVFDPCMGSGHILVYTFEVLMQIYLECGYTERDATSLILENNLFGLDIDDRAYQLAYFAVMMKARSYDRRILTRNIKPNVYSIKESNFLVDSWQKISDDEKFRKIFQTIVDTFIDAKEYGSILNVSDADYDYALSVIDDFEQSVPVDFEAQILRGKTDDIRALVNQAKLMAKKYTTVVTNPPYMNKFDAKLKKYIADNFAEYKGDLFSVFMYHNFSFCTPDGYSAFMTPLVWMFIKTYEPLRNYILSFKHLSTLIQFEYSAFEEATVPICTFVLRNDNDINKSLCFRLSDFKGGMEVQKQKVLEALADKSCGYYYETDQTNFSKIPGSPIAYWVSENIISDFQKGKVLKDEGDTRQGMATSDNNRFLRMWFEIENNTLGLSCGSSEEALAIHKKWYPYNKGGEFRKWYGNIEYVINYEDDGFEVKEYAKSLYKTPTRTIKSMSEYFKRCLSWSKISSGNIAFRYYPKGFVFDVAGCCIFYQNSEMMLYSFGFINSKVTISILNAIS
ncbi:BREX-1 system adenine-specific DNA-methyltransferase PglX, partial [Holdemanella porci]|uniref:BREX-1 system adenine-specific DNA-methyltransferase PglX n=1 Tax=Holdemanella porci TaxID=2652276 RepID=UPI003AEF1B2B